MKLSLQVIFINFGSLLEHFYVKADRMLPDNINVFKMADMCCVNVLHSVKHETYARKDSLNYQTDMEMKGKTLISTL